MCPASVSLWKYDWQYLREDSEMLANQITMYPWL